MARLPDPICEELKVDWSEDYKKRESFIYKMVAVAIRERNRKEKKKGDEKEDRD